MELANGVRMMQNHTRKVSQQQHCPLMVRPLQFPILAKDTPVSPPPVDVAESMPDWLDCSKQSPGD